MSEITKALVKFKKAAPSVVKNKHVSAGAKQYDYADLAEVTTTIDPILADCGLFLSQSFVPNGATYLVTTIMHESGDKIESKIELPINGLTPQQVGSVITYYRRYSALALLGIAPENDDDGEAAQKAGAVHGKQSVLTQQIKESIAAEAPRNGDQIVAEKYAMNKDYDQYLKETPKGRCWKVTAIQQAMRDFVHDLEGQSEEAELERFLADNYFALDACAAALPNWYYGKPGSDIPGIEKRIIDKKAELLKTTIADPSRYLRV